MRFIPTFGLFMLTMGLAFSLSAQDLKPMPHDSGNQEAPAVEKVDTAPPPPPVSEEVSSGLSKNYWLMPNGSPVGYKLDIKVNGNGVTSVRRGEQALDLNPQVKPGLNTITISQSETGSAGSGQLTVTVGPELSRQAQGANQTFISLKENPIHFVRPADHRGGAGDVTLHFSIGETPNPELTQRYILYSQGVLSGHKIQVGLNGSTLVDIAAPGAYCDLNPFLKKGKNEFTFSSEKMEGFSFSSDDRSKMEGQNFEVGIAILGPYDPATYDTQVSQLTNVVLRYTQPADQDEPEGMETLSLEAN
ncbi:MAG: hypothetical protein H6751_08605 [Candidatus Omnitrophica bacterium]|nr:hypothetical protein [Candidatus Omnitrophota bacterium]